MTNIIVLNDVYEVVAVVDTPFELIWVERYFEAGEFTLLVPTELDALKYLIPDNHLIIEESDYMMMIEDVDIESGGETGNRVKIIGESVEAKMKWRVISEPLTIDTEGNWTELFMVALFADNFTAPTDPNRTVPNLEVDWTTSNIGPYEYENYLEGGTVYDILKELCASLGLGVRLTFMETTRKLRFTTLEGTDRSHEQTENPRVIFSEVFNNIISSGYYWATKNSKNVMLALTPDVDPTIERIFVFDGTEPVGAARREGFVKLTKPGVTDPPLTVPETQLIIESQAKEELHKFRSHGIFDGDFNLYGTFEYRKDFFLGDFVQCVISDKSVKARIIERVLSITSDGIKDYVSFDFPGL